MSTYRQTPWMYDGQNVGSTNEISKQLAWLNSVLDSGVRAFRRNLEDPYRGLYVSDQDVDEALESLPAQDPPEHHLHAVRNLRERLQTMEGCPTDPVVRLGEIARLDPFERGVVLLCLGPEIDLRYQRIFAYLHDDIAKKAPTVELALTLLCADGEQRMRAHGVLAPEGMLRSLGLIEVIAPEVSAPFLAYSLRLTDRLRRYLLAGDGGATPRLPPFVALASADRNDHLATRATLPDTLDLHPGAEHPGWIQISGDDGPARRGMALEIAARLGMTLLSVDCAALLRERPDDPGSVIRELHCEAITRNALLFWDELDGGEGRRSDAPSLVPHLRARSGLTIVGTRTPRSLSDREGRTSLLLEVSALTASSRQRLWRRALDGLPGAEGIDDASLAARYTLDTDQIGQAVRFAATQVGERPLRTADLERACRIVAAPHLAGLAEPIDVPHDFDDLVLPTERLAVLRDVCEHARYRGIVDERWGFGRAGTAGRGLSVLLSGPSGTGKTMSAGIIARELGLELYRVDLARLVSKYIGETEKNLARVFDATRRSAACLLFDEADAVFAKRSEVKDAHDRFANLETSYLLQRLEHHDGVVFLSTNLRHNIDGAFTRRLGFIIHFSPPDEALRAELWRRAFPPEVPLSSDVDIRRLAAAHFLTGGNIRNVARAAAIHAWAEDRPICSTDLNRAIAREYEKMGKAWTGDRV